MNKLPIPRSVIDSTQVLSDPGELIPYETDSSLDRATPDLVVFPRTTQEVSRVVRWAGENGLPIVARGAGTGRSGGAVPEHGGVMVEFSQMERVLEFDDAGRSAVVEPGLVNQTLDTLVRTRNLYYPPDPSSGRVATMGGNVAENAGGPHCFKYGVTSKYITGLQVVLADGRIVRMGGRALDYPEYDLVGLMTGNEGTLGIITQIDARLLRNPPGVRTMMAAFDTIADAGNAVSAVIAAGLVPATLEMMDQQIMRFIEEYNHPGLPVDAGAMLIVEVDGYPDGLDAQMDEICAILKTRGARELRIARTAQERDAIWFGRKSAGGAYPHYTVDSTVPRSALAETLQAANEICARYRVRVGHVFHAGDGNLHPSILMHEQDRDEVERVVCAAREIMQEVVRHDGAVTGEHGVGIEKREFMPLMYNAEELSALWDVKQAFDPHNRLNPGKIFPAQMPPAHPVAASPVVPEGVFAPASAEEAAAGLRALSNARRKVIINGQAPNAVTLSTQKLTGIRVYAPDDLFITVGAGTRLDEVQAFLAKDKRQVALVSPWREATIGGLVAANVNSPQRMLYGAVRDQILCATVALADGRVIRAGRPVVKNVAGYDLPKVLVGSFGTLGLLVDVTLKLTPLPRAKRTLRISVNDLARGSQLGMQLLPRALVASAIVLGKNDSAGYVLAYTAEGIPEDVEAELTQIRQSIPESTEVTTPSGTELWSNLIGQAVPNALQLRIGVAPKDSFDFIQAHHAVFKNGPFLADLANGLLYAVKEFEEQETARQWVEELRRDALSRGGYALVTHMPAEWNGAIDRRGYQPKALDMMHALKRRWDPAEILGADWILKE